MKVINVRNCYDIHDDTLRTFDSLPAGVYEVEFSDMTGFHLMRRPDIVISEKIYGKHMAKVGKVFRAFDNSHRSLGVILSGKKGIGKSMFAKLASVRAVENGYPVILVNKYIPGIASYIESIEQECLVLFDEYDKTFGGIKTADGQANTQTEMLTLFDGLAQGKKLFVITCNDLYRLSEYLVNRPGRFHYHFRFDCPDSEEIREYLTDKLDEAYYGEIDKVVVFAKKVDLNYDCLRAIAFELNSGEPFETAIVDMNILNTDNEIYRVEVRYPNGRKLISRGESLDLFDAERPCTADLDDENGNYIAKVSFEAMDCHYDMKRGTIVVDGSNLKFDYVIHPSKKEKIDAFQSMKPDYLTLKRNEETKLHYAL